MPTNKINAPKLAANERALIQAVKKKDAIKVRNLILRGVDVNCGNVEWPFSNITPLMYASELRDFRIVQALLKAGADVHARDKSEAMQGGEGTVLHYAILLHTEGKPNLKIINALLDAGADPNARAANGNTVLDWACSGGHFEAVQALLKNGGNPNATTNESGWNALSGAVSNGHIEIVKILLEAGANPNGTSVVGATAIMDAAVCPSAVERKGSGKVDLEIMRLLRKFGAKVDARTVKGQTALMFSCDEAACSLAKKTFVERFAAVRFLVEEGKAQLNLKDSDGKTALDYASISDFPELPEYLRKKGAKSGKA